MHKNRQIPHQRCQILKIIKLDLELQGILLHYFNIIHTSFIGKIYSILMNPTRNYKRKSFYEFYFLII